MEHGTVGTVEVPVKLEKGPSLKIGSSSTTTDYINRLYDTTSVPSKTKASGQPVKRTETDQIKRYTPKSTNRRRKTLEVAKTEMIFKLFGDNGGNDLGNSSYDAQPHLPFHYNDLQVVSSLESTNYPTKA
ncbi:hypothetical protein RUM43_011813 [Polyplax serrata]|uniref:Uncharacterized protein n=1 Tax=Polyplax serrata TaxID=468196 RepID=A0AAN8P5W7_POLSC